MATTTIADLPVSRALDYRAMSAIRGAGGAPWVFTAFRPFMPPVVPILPIVNFYQTNFFADQLNLETQNISVQNSAPGATITVGAAQNALNVIAVSASLHP